MSQSTSPSEADIIVNQDDPAIAVVTLNRPRRRNAVKLVMWRELGEIFARLGNERDVRAIILTGAGGAFSAGADISEFSTVRKTVEDGRVYEETANDCQMAIRTCPKPTIAAISGPCYGGGVGIALSCDFRVADASAYFAIPAARLSNVYGTVETGAVYDAVGLAVAKEVLFTGRRYDAEEAHRVGMATHLVPEDAIGFAQDFAADLKKSAPLTIVGAKVVLSALARRETEQRQEEIQRIADQAMASSDYKEGVAAFAEKRDPQFRGE